jgi:hypothetical protein
VVGLGTWKGAANRTVFDPNPFPEGRFPEASFSGSVIFWRHHFLEASFSEGIIFWRHHFLTAPEAARYRR